MSLPWSSKGFKATPVSLDELMIIDSEDANPATQNKRILIGSISVGEVNTSSNVGAGDGWAKAKVGVDLPFKSLITNAPISTTVNTNDLTLTLDQLVDADISASAAIAFSKLAPLSDGWLLIGSNSNVATQVPMSGDATIINSGLLTISNDAVDDNKIATHTSTKITINNKPQLNSNIVYTDQANTYGSFVQEFPNLTLNVLNPAETFSYIIQSNPITANRNIQLPTLTANDTFAMVSHAQSLTNKTLVQPTITDYTNANHNHSTTALGGNLTNSALSTGVFSNIEGIGVQSQDLQMGGNNVKSLAAPLTSLDAANKQYVDEAIEGLSWKESALLATTANIVLNGNQVIDGVLTTTSDRILVKDQTSSAENGLYSADAGAWTRTTDADSESDLVNMSVFIQQGTVNQDTSWVLTTDPPIVVDVTPLNYAQIAGSFNSPLTTTGDLLGYDTGDNRIPVGSNGQVLTANNAVSLGVEWQTPSLTPWISNIDAAGFALLDTNYVEAGSGLATTYASTGQFRMPDQGIVAWRNAGDTGNNFIQSDDLELTFNNWNAITVPTADVDVDLGNATVFGIETLEVAGSGSIDFGDTPVFSVATIQWSASNQDQAISLGNTEVISWEKNAGTGYAGVSSRATDEFVIGFSAASPGALVAEYTFDETTADFLGNTLTNIAIFESNATNVSSVGAIRLGDLEKIAFRNSTNDADFEITSDDPALNFSGWTTIQWGDVDQFDFGTPVAITGIEQMDFEGGGTLEMADTPINDVGGMTFTDGVRITFNPDATNSGLNVGAQASPDPTSPVNGDIYYNSTTNTFRAYENGSWTDVIGSASPLTTKGDIYTYDTADARLPVGTDGFVLSADSAEATGLKWIAAAAGSQTPWTSDIDADGFDLTDLGHIQMRPTTDPGTGLNSIYAHDVDDMTISVAGAAGIIKMRMNTQIEYEFKNNTIVMNNAGLTNPGNILDANNNEYLQWVSAASAVNHIRVHNAQTSVGALIDTFGGDTNIDLRLQPKGFADGSVYIVNRAIKMGEQSTPTAPGAGLAKLYVKDVSARSHLFIQDDVGETDLNLGGSQTPWTSNIDAAGFNLFDLSYVEFNTVNPAQSGAIRLSDTEQILWRNNGNTSDIGIDVNNDIFNFVGIATFGATSLSTINAQNAVANFDAVNVFSGIDFGSSDITSLNVIEFDPSGEILFNGVATQGIQGVGAGLIFSLPTGDSYDFQINSVSEYTFNATEANFQNNLLKAIATPVDGTDAANKTYVDNLVNGLSWKNPAEVATTGNITLSGEQTIDGVLTSTDRVLVKDQTSGEENGVYVSAAGAWTRSTDADSESDLLNMSIYISQGSTNADTSWVLTTDAPIVVDTTILTYAQIGAGTGNPLTTKGDIFGYDTANARIPVGTDGQVLTANSAVALGVDWQTPTTGDVVGPAGATDNAIARYDTTTGKLIQDSGVTIDDNNTTSHPGPIVLTAAGTVPSGTETYFREVANDLIVNVASAQDIDFNFGTTNRVKITTAGIDLLTNNLAQAVITSSSILNGTQVQTAGLSYANGLKQTFNPSSANAGLNVGGQVDPDPSAPVNGDIYYNSTNNKFRAYEAGTWVDMIPASGGDVTGPGSSTDNELVRFNGATGKIIQATTIPVVMNDAGEPTWPRSIKFTNYTASPLGSVAYIVNVFNELYYNGPSGHRFFVNNVQKFNVGSTILGLTEGYKLQGNSDATEAAYRDTGHTADPSSASAGDFYYNTTTNKYRSYNGATWDELGVAVSDTPWTEAHDFAGFLLTWDAGETNLITTQQSGNVLVNQLADNVVGIGESWGTNDGNLSIKNTNAGNVWRGELRNDQPVTDASGFFLITSAIAPASDTGTVPIMVFDSRQNDDTTVVTRDLFAWRNNGVDMISLSRGGDMTFNSVNLLDLNLVREVGATASTPVAGTFLHMDLGSAIAWDRSSGNNVDYIDHVNDQIQIGFNNVLSYQFAPSTIALNDNTISESGGYGFGTGASASTLITGDAGGMILSVPSGDNIALNINSVDEYTFSATALDVVGNDIDNIQNLIHDISASGTDIDFTEDEMQTISIAANTTFTTTNRAAGKSKVLKITTDGTLRTFTFPGWDWTSAIPANQAANKNGYLTLTCFGTTDASIVASYLVGSL